MIIKKYKDEKEIKSIVQAQAVLGYYLVGVSSSADGNFLGFDNGSIPEIPLPNSSAEQQVIDNQLAIMNALTDIYMAMP